MRDGDIRLALHERLREQHRCDLDTLLIDEFGLCGQVRVDVAVVNGTLSGYEVKSDRDTLRRLPLQVQIYSQCLDYATLVVGERHHEHAKWATHVPDWWGVLVAVAAPNGVVLSEARPAQPNDAVHADSLACLLWRDELLAELQLRGLDLGLRSKPRAALSCKLATCLPLEELRAVVRHRLKTREDWRQPVQHA